MYSEKDLIERLKNGESSDAIAKEFTDALNKAMKKAEDIIVDETAEYKARLTDAQDIVEAVNKYAANWDIKINGKDTIEAEDVVDILDKLVYLSLYSSKIETKFPDTLSWFKDWFI